MGHVIVIFDNEDPTQSDNPEDTDSENGLDEESEDEDPEDKAKYASVGEGDGVLTPVGEDVVAVRSVGGGDSVVISVGEGNGAITSAGDDGGTDKSADMHAPRRYKQDSRPEEQYEPSFQGEKYRAQLFSTMKHSGLNMDKG